MAAELLGRGFELPRVLRALRLAKSTYYYNLSHPKTDHYADVRPLIHEIYRRTRNGMGYRQVRLALIQEQGLAISRKTVWKLMREEGLFCRIRRKHYNSYKGEVGKMAENLLNRDFQADRPFQKLTTDVTEFALRDGKAYLSPVMDLCGNKIVSWSVKKNQGMGLINEMLDGLFEQLPEGAEPLLHSDQGWQYRMGSYRNKLEKHGLKQSMSRKATCHDNACMEGFFGHLKDELYWGQRFESFEQFEQELDQYIYYWNTKRYQETLGGLAPEEYQAQRLGVLEAA